MQDLGYELPRTPLRNCPKRGVSNALPVALGRIRRPKWVEKCRFGSPRGYAAGSSGPFRTVSSGMSAKPYKSVGPGLHNAGYERAPGP